MDMQGACSSTLDGAAVTVNMIGWCSDCQQNDIVLAPALHEVLAVTDSPLVQYRQVMSCVPKTPDLVLALQQLSAALPAEARGLICHDVECQPPGMIQLVVTQYSMDHSNISLQFYDMAGSGSLQAVQIGHADEVLQLQPLHEHIIQAIPFEGFVGSVQTGMQFASLGNSTQAQAPGSTQLLPTSSLPGSSPVLSDPGTAGPASSFAYNNQSNAHPAGTLSTHADPNVGHTYLPSKSPDASTSGRDAQGPSGDMLAGSLSLSDSPESPNASSLAPLPSNFPLPSISLPISPPPPALHASSSALPPTNNATLQSGSVPNPNASLPNADPARSTSPSNAYALPPSLMTGTTDQAEPPSASTASRASLRAPNTTTAAAEAPHGASAIATSTPSPSSSSDAKDLAAAAAPAFQSSSPGPGDAQAQNIIQSDPVKEHTPVIVLASLLGAAVAAMLAGLCVLLALGAVGCRRKPALVSEETNTDPDAGHGVTLAAVETHDPMFFLQDSFGTIKWNQNTTYQDPAPWHVMKKPVQKVNAGLLVPETAHTGRNSELYEAEAVAAAAPAAPAALPAMRGSAVSGYAVQQAARHTTLNKVEPPGAAVLEVQRLDVSQSGLLNLKLFQKAGDVLLQSLNIRQSTEGRVQHGWTPLSRVNASTWHLQSFFLKPPFDLHVTGSLGRSLFLGVAACCLPIACCSTQGPEKKRKARSMPFSSYDRSLLRQHPTDTGGSADSLSTGCSELHCQQETSTGQANNMLLKLKPARQSLKEQVDVLSQQPLAASPHFFSLKAPDPTQQEIVAVPARTTPPPAEKPTPGSGLLRAHMLDSWPSSTSVDAEDAMHGNLSSTWSSVKQEDSTQEEYAEKSPGFVPTPAGMDVRASKTVSRLFKQSDVKEAIYQRLDFAEEHAVTKRVPRHQPTLEASDLMQHYPPTIQQHASTDSRITAASSFSESASTLELNLPSTFGGQNFTQTHSLCKVGRYVTAGDWRAEQLAGSCIPQGNKMAARGQYANWASPSDALMGSALSFQSELLESYQPSVHSGANNYASTEQQSSYGVVRHAGLAGTRENPVFDDSSSEPESTDTWPFDNMSFYAPASLQHTHSKEKSVCLASVARASAEQKFNMMEIADSAWETLHKKNYLSRCSDSSCSSVTCDTSFIKHVGDKLFDKITK
ncbi:TPA: hypothetical protein ACH3X1_009067 [Trebouxia sp. C0004]